MSACGSQQPTRRSAGHHSPRQDAKRHSRGGSGAVTSGRDARQNFDGSFVKSVN